MVIVMSFSFSFALNPSGGNAFGSKSSKGEVELSPAQKAVKKLEQHPQAKERLSSMRVEVSSLSGSLNIFDTTIEDMKFFSEILGNEDCSYTTFLRLSSFYY